MQTAPPVSIGLPVYNGADFVAEAIESLLAQTHSDFELIVSDNASTDATPAICEAYARRDPRLRVLRSPENLGAARNFNRVFEAARGRYFMWAAHDDFYAPRFVEACLDRLEREPEAVLCFAGTKMVGARGEELADYRYDLPTADPDRRTRFLSLVAANHIVIEIFGLCRREALAKTSLIGSYVGSDVVLLAELALMGPFLQCPEPLFFHREHAKRSVKVNPDLASRLEWFDTRKRGRRSLPMCRKLFEHLRSVGRSGCGLKEKAALALDVARVANWRRADVARELAGALGR